MSYPKVSFERKPLVTLKTFSNRNARPGRAALGAGERRPVCVTTAGYDRCPSRAGGRGFSDCAAMVKLTPAARGRYARRHCVGNDAGTSNTAASAQRRFGRESVRRPASRRPWPCRPPPAAARGAQLAVGRNVLEADRDPLRDARLLHGHAVERSGAGHRFLGMRDDYELRPGQNSCSTPIKRSMLASSSAASTSSSTQNGLGRY